MARATKKASASRTSRPTASSSGRAKASKPSKKAAGTSRKPAAKAQPKKPAKKPVAKKPVAKTSAKKAVPKKAPQKKIVKQVTGTRKAGKTTVSAKKVSAKTGKQATASKAKATAKPVKTAAKPVVKPAKAEAPSVKAPKKQEPPVVETAPKKPRKRELTSREIAQIRTQLEQQKENFLREYNELEEGSFTVSQSEMSGEVSFDEEYADAGTFTFEREKELSIGNNIRDLLDRVNAAINAIDAGTYGFCESCGDPINKARLIALPYTTLCIRCKQLEERSR